MSQCESAQLGDSARVLACLLADGVVDCRDPAWELRRVVGVCKNGVEGSIAKEDTGTCRVLEDKGRAVVAADEVDHPQRL